MLSINGTTAYNTANIEGRTFTDSNADVEKLKFDTQAISFNDVTNTTNIDSNLAVTGLTTLQDITVNGSLVGDFDVSGNFSASGNISTNGDVMIYDKRATPKPYIFATDADNHLKLTYQPATLNYTIMDCSFNNFGDSELYLRRKTHATNGLEIDNYANVADTKKLYLGGTSTGSEIFHTNSTNTLHIEAGASNSIMTLRTNNNSGIGTDVTINTSTFSIPQTLSIPSYSNVTSTLDTINAKLTDVSYNGVTYNTNISGNFSISGNENLTANMGSATAYGLEFSRNGNRVLGDTTYSAYTQGTIEIWYKNRGSIANAQYIFGVENAFNILLIGTNILATSDFGGGTFRASSTYITDEKWHHLALVFDLTTPSSSTLYYDGLPVLSNVTTTATTPGILYIGSLGGSSTSVQGEVDEARIWNVKRTDAEILANYKATLTSATGLTGSWLMNEGTGTSLANSVSGAPSLSFWATVSPIWSYGRDAVTLNALGQANMTFIKARNMILGEGTTYNPGISVDLKMTGKILMGDRANLNLAPRAMNIHDTNALINISRYSNSQPGFELQNYDPTTNTVRNTVLFLGGGSTTTANAILRLGTVDAYYATPTLFSTTIPAEVNIPSTFSISGTTPTFRIRNNVTSTRYIDYIFNHTGAIYNSLVQTGDITMIAQSSTGANNSVLTICPWSSNGIGIRMTGTTMTIGGNTDFTSNSNVTQSGSGIISQSGTGTNALKSTDFTGNVTISGTLDYSGEPKAYFPTMNISEDLSFLGSSRSEVMPKCMNCDLATSNVYSSTSQARNLVMMGIVKVFKGTTYTGVVGFYSGNPIPGGANPTVRVALYNVGTSPSKLAENTTAQTITGGGVGVTIKSIPFASTWTADATKWVCVMAVSTNQDIQTAKFDLSSPNWTYTSGGAGKIDLVACYYTGFAGTFPTTFTATPTAYGSKYILGLY